MTQVTKTTLATSISTLAPDNTSGQITASNLRSLLTDSKDSAYFLSTNTIADVTSGVAGPGSSTTRTVAIANGTAGLTIQYSGVVIDASNNIVLPNGAALGTDTTTAHTAILQAYDVDGAAYKTFGTLTNANTPSFALAAPSGGSLTIDGAVIGGVTPAAASVTAMTATATSNQLVLGTTRTLTLTAPTPASSSRTVTLPDPGGADSVAYLALAQTFTNKTLTDSIHTNSKVCSAQLDAVTGTTGTTLTNIPGLSVAVTAAGTYVFEAHLTGTSTANGGAKFAIANSGTTTSCSYVGVQNNGTTQNAHTTTTTMGNAVGASTSVFTDAQIRGVVIVANAGNLTVQMAQNAAHADTTSVYIGSYFRVTRVA